MQQIRVTRNFEFEAGHALYGYDGKCKNVHGHSYKLSVTVKGIPISDASHVKNGMVIDFSDLKKIVQTEIIDVFDHATMLNKNSPHAELGEELLRRGHQILLVNFQPTSEMMLLHFVKIIQEKLPKSVTLYTLKLQETGSSCAVWCVDDQE